MCGAIPHKMVGTLHMAEIWVVYSGTHSLIWAESALRLEYTQTHGHLQLIAQPAGEGLGETLVERREEEEACDSHKHGHFRWCMDAHQVSRQNDPKQLSSLMPAQCMHEQTLHGGEAWGRDEDAQVRMRLWGEAVGNLPWPR